MSGNRLILLGFFGVLIGAVVPFGIILGFLPSTFFLNFISFISSVVGIFLGVIGVATYVGKSRQHDDGYWDA